ncbi:MAG TPA: MFS transporter, partial [Ktedonobacteraceae bacterium]|nr:MFS transporter [Ktedonobacteraceae bacterium]
VVQTHKPLGEHDGRKVRRSIHKDLREDAVVVSIGRMETGVKAKRLSIRQELAINLLWFPTNALNGALLAVVIPTQILLFVPSARVGDAQQGTFLGWLTTVASFVALFMPPLIGSLSDLTPGRFGRRHPYIVAGGVLMLISTPLLVISSDLVMFLIGLSFLHLGINTMMPAYQSLVPDHVPERQRGEASGYVGSLTIMGNMLSLGLAAFLLGGVSQHSTDPHFIRHNAGIYYIVTIGITLVCILITVTNVHEVPFKPQPRSPADTQEAGRKRFEHWFMHSWIDPWRKHNFTIVFLTRASIMLALAMFMTFIEYYFAHVQHVTNFVTTTAVVAVFALGGGVVSGLVFGILSDRLKRRAPVVSVAAIFMSFTALAFVVLPSSGTAPGSLSLLLWPLGVCFGLGHGAFSSVDWALTIDALPSLKEAGKDLGLWSASNTLPAILAPLLGGIIITIADGYHAVDLGYRAIFLLASLFLIVAAICILFVREKRNVQKQNTTDEVSV